MTEVGARMIRPIRQICPISQVRPQERVAVRGEVRSVTAMALRGCPACRCTLTDGTGTLDLMFLGRLEVRGLEKGRFCRAEGMAALWDDRIALWNPRYELEPATAPNEAAPPQPSGPAIPADGQVSRSPRQQADLPSAAGGG
jgi:hypothetical protein